MPLKRGKSRKIVSENIRTLMHDYERSGRIGNIHPKSRKHAQRIAIAIAMRMQREGKKGGKKRGKSKER